MTSLRVRNSLQNGLSPRIVGKGACLTPNFYSCIILLGRQTNNYQDIKNSVMLFFGKCENVVLAKCFGKIFSLHFVHDS